MTPTQANILASKKSKQLITVSISETNRDTLLRLSRRLHGGDIARTVEESIEQYDDHTRGAWDHGTEIRR